MRHISCLVLPIPAHSFFEQAIFQGEVGYHLLQCGRLTTKILHLAGCRGTRRVARQSALAGFEEQYLSLLGKVPKGYIFVNSIAILN
jgi:hypothetical protein